MEYMIRSSIQQCKSLHILFLPAPTYQKPLDDVQSLNFCTRLLPADGSPSNPSVPNSPLRNQLIIHSFKTHNHATIMQTDQLPAADVDGSWLAKRQTKYMSLKLIDQRTHNQPIIPSSHSIIKLTQCSTLLLLPFHPIPSHP
ncbi:hypothetical protein M758_9G022000, partial [Ceratodon purpureus]